MTPRAHLVLRLAGLFVLLAVTAWPARRGLSTRPHATTTTTAAHLAVTTAARLEVDVVRGREQVESVGGVAAGGDEESIEPPSDTDATH